MSVQVLQRLQEAIAAVCPIVGVSIGIPGDVGSVRIDFDNATASQQAAALAALLAFDWSQGPQQTWQQGQQQFGRSLLFTPFTRDLGTGGQSGTWTSQVLPA